jgi:hypothetical protein
MRRENAAEAAYVLDRSYLDGPLDVGNIWGSGLTVAAGSAGLFGLGVLTREPSLRDAGKDLGTAFLATSAVVLPMKMLVDLAGMTALGRMEERKHFCRTSYSEAPWVWRWA